MIISDIVAVVHSGLITYVSENDHFGAVVNTNFQWSETIGGYVLAFDTSVFDGDFKINTNRPERNIVGGIAVRPNGVFYVSTNMELIPIFDWHTKEGTLAVGCGDSSLAAMSVALKTLQRTRRKITSKNLQELYAMVYGDRIKKSFKSIDIRAMMDRAADMQRHNEIVRELQSNKTK